VASTRLFLLGIGVASTAACASTSQPVPAAPSAPSVTATPPEAPPSATAARTITVLVSAESPAVYCNGERMDSDAYRKTLTREKPVTLPPAGASDTEVVRAVLAVATEGMCQTVMTQLDYKNDRGTLHIPPFDAWAGVSIAMCHCQPEVEVNAVRIPGIERVVWDEE
jgi:hypothetical protein